MKSILPYIASLSLLALAPEASAQRVSPADTDAPNTVIVSTQTSATPQVREDEDVRGAPAPPSVPSTGSVVDTDDPTSPIVSSPSPTEGPVLHMGRDGAATRATLGPAVSNPYPNGRDVVVSSGVASGDRPSQMTTTSDGRDLGAEPGTPAGGDAVSTTLEVAMGAAPEAAHLTAASGDLALEPNMPNPVGVSTRIGFTVPTTGAATIELFDIRGRLVTLLFDGIAEGNTPLAVTLDASALASGTYVYVLTHNGERLTRTLQVTR